jgi:hypothetical protein
VRLVSDGAAVTTGKVAVTGRRVGKVGLGAGRRRVEGLLRGGFAGGSSIGVFVGRDGARGSTAFEVFESALQLLACGLLALFNYAGESGTYGSCVEQCGSGFSCARPSR